VEGQRQDIAGAEQIVELHQARNHIQCWDCPMLDLYR
jgi:hypothetical protein